MNDVPTGEELGLFGPMEWLYDHAFYGPAIGFWLVAAYFLTGLLVENRVINVRNHKQYTGFMPGYLLVALAILCFGLAAYSDQPVDHEWWQNIIIRWVSVVGAVMVAGGLMVVEISIAIKQKHNPQAYTYTVYQLLTPVALINRLIMFLLTCYTIQLMFAGPWGGETGRFLFFKVVGFVMLGLWAWCIQIDNQPDGSGRPADLGEVFLRENAWFPLIVGLFGRGNGRNGRNGGPYVRL